ncbi:hypothetical protein CLPU_18c00560 [Gottschalkia purinilytica]|uniref:Uncharacterized protein n=1 Tax=Gottschalkia purinilytica TaxID=1503 RepID=A0A0L0W785_GOTPU|nr:hypothetical protein [Gottschalkia purinilytica]KNF07374.1 hypothetical protein CLPU_18c00560 [Gottschalkia purinilytica]
MLSKFLIIVFCLLSFSYFKNIFLSRGAGRNIFDSVEKVIFSTIISIIGFMLIIFILESLFKLSINTISIIEGIIIGWIVALFAHIKNV